MTHRYRKWFFLTATCWSLTLGTGTAQPASGNTPAAQRHADFAWERLRGWELQSVEATFEGFVCVTTLKGGVGFRRKVLQQQEEARQLFSDLRAHAIEASGSVGCVVYASSQGRQFAEAAVRSFLDRSKSMVYFYGAAPQVQP